MSRDAVKRLLATKFAQVHVTAILKHFADLQEKFVEEKWDAVCLKAGKFVEAVTKALMVHCGQNLPAARDFKAGNELRKLEQLPKGTHAETVRIVIPKACVFIYEVVNNRGGRHDPGDLDANPMDATAIVPLASWVLAEMVRYCDGRDTGEASDLIAELTQKIYPYFEEIDGRAYVNVRNLGGPDYALLLLYFRYPKRMTRRELVESIARHGVTENAAGMAITRMSDLLDDNESGLLLRAVGRQKAEELLKRLRRP
ncbi:MAG: hypothetical protein KBA31_09615 [Alphaproteobacteria bacterium]|nr:hypothetical protein [Alphaproteobacteria bacterium]